MIYKHIYTVTRTFESAPGDTAETIKDSFACIQDDIGEFLYTGESAAEIIEVKLEFPKKRIA